MKIKSLFLIVCAISVLVNVEALGQIAVNEDGSAPDASAVLDLYSTSKGFLLPRMTEYQQKIIVNPATGLIVFNIDSLDLYIYKGSYWVSVLKCDDKDTIYPWTCGDYIVDNRDGITYSTVLIGNQCWLAENLSSNKYRNGDNIPNVTDGTAWSNLTTGAYCWYNNDSATYDSTYGKLYNWFALDDIRDLCPTGWHAPTDAEWTILTDYLGGTHVAGGKMKSTGTFEAGTGLWNAPNTGATNESGFTAIPGGGKDVSPGFWNIHQYAIFWSSTEHTTYTYSAWCRGMPYNTDNADRFNDHKAEGCSVRCVKD